MGYEVLRYRPDLKPAALTLLAHAWGHDAERNARTFAWKFERNPYLEQPLLQIVAADGQPVAIRSLHGVRWLRGPDGAALQALGTGDFAIDPAHRGRHLFGRIMSAAAAEARERGCRYLVSLSAGPATRLQSLRAGWRDLGEITTLQRMSPAALVRRLLHEKMTEHQALRALTARARRQAWLRTAAGVRRVSDRFKPRACARTDALNRGAEPQRFGPATARGHGQPDRTPQSA
jgi:GNAT superfamily N-acetyltransferase